MYAFETSKAWNASSDRYRARLNSVLLDEQASFDFMGVQVSVLALVGLIKAEMGGQLTPNRKIVQHYKRRAAEDLWSGRKSFRPPQLKTQILNRAIELVFDDFSAHLEHR